MRAGTAWLAVFATFLLAPLPASAATHSPAGRMLGVVPARTASGAALGPRVDASGIDLGYHGGPVMHADAVYAIYWEPPGHTSSADYKDAIDGYLADVAADSGKTTNVYAAQTLYYDTAGPLSYSQTFAGRIVDENPYPTSGGCGGGAGSRPCLTDAQLQTELQRLVAADGLPTGEQTMYLIFTPPNVDTCDDGWCAFSSFCAYHSWIGSGPTALIYADQPYLAGADGCDTENHPNGDADPTINTVSHEQNEAVTDPEGTGWWDDEGEEIGDKCAWTFGTPLGSTPGGYFNQVIGGHDYWLQQEWSNLGSTCVLTNDGIAPPTVTITSGYPTGAAPGQQLDFAATAFDPQPGVTIDSYSWDFGDGQTATGATASHAYAGFGVYTVTVTATASDGQTASDSEEIELSEEPTAVIAAPASVQAGSGLTFDASGSHGPGGPISSYAWSLYDSSSGYEYASGPTVTVTPAHPGYWYADLTVTDAAGFSGYASVYVTVTARPPSAAITATVDRQFTGLSIDFDGTGSTGLDNPLVSYLWDFGDGHTSTSSSPSHSYAAAGDYAVSLTVTDSSGAVAYASHAVTVVARPPIPLLVALPRAPVAGEDVEFDGSGSYAPDGAVAAYAWSFGDGQAGVGPTPDHVYASPGVYTATLTVTDSAGAAATTVRQITVVAPAPAAGPPAVVVAPTPEPTPAVVPVAVPVGGVGLARHQRLATLRRVGLRFSVSCAAACRITYAFVVPPRPGPDGTRTAELLLRGGSSALAAGGTRRMTTRLSRVALARLAANRAPLLIVELTAPGTGASSWYGAATAVS